MKPRERVQRILNHEEADRVPLIMCGAHTGITRLAYERFTRYLGLDDRHGRLVDRVQQVVEPDEDVLRRFDIDFRTIYIKGPSGWRDIEYPDDSFRDEWGVRWKRPPGGYWYDMVEHPLEDAVEEDLEEYKWPDPEDPGRYEGLEEEARALYEKTDYALATGLIGSIFEQSWYLRSFPKFMFDLYRNKGFAEKLMDKILDFHMRVYDRFLDEVGDYVDVVFVGDDLAEQNGLTLRPEIYRSLVKPRHKKLYEFIKTKADVKICYHSCGAVRPLIRDLIEIGVDVLTPVQVSAANMDTAGLKEEYGDSISFIGGIDTQRVLPFGTPEDVEREVKLRIRDLAPGGGFVPAAVHNIQPEVPPENIYSMLISGKKYGKYSLPEPPT